MTDASFDLHILITVDEYFVFDNNDYTQRNIFEYIWSKASSYIVNDTWLS